MRLRTTAGLVLAGMASLASGAVQAEEKMSVVATFSILADFVEKVGGDRVAVRTLVGPEADAHVYQPSPADAADVGKAKVVFQNGLGFEGWMERLVQSSGYKGPLVVATKGIEPIKGEEDDHDDHEKHKGEKHDDHAKEGGHDHGDIDPHAWQSVPNAILYVANVKEGLCAADKDGCPVYTHNAAAYAVELNKLNEEIKSKVAAIPEKSRKVITSHDAFGYFAKAYGVEFLSPTGVSTESEASAKDVAKLIDQIKKDGVKAVFVENITDTRLIEQIAKETGAKIGGTLYSDALSKKEGPAKSYLDMMRHNAGLLAGAMAGS
ncbi:MAG: metal ABC transporter substrate-binding protein [Hyphomicrobiaceae bacterium]